MVMMFLQQKEPEIGISSIMVESLLSLKKRMLPPHNSIVSLQKHLEAEDIVPVFPICLSPFFAFGHLVDSILAKGDRE